MARKGTESRAQKNPLRKRARKRHGVKTNHSEWTRRESAERKHGKEWHQKRHQKRHHVVTFPVLLPRFLLLPHSRTPNPEMRLKCIFKFGVKSHLQVPSGRCHILGSLRLYLSSIQPTQQALLQLYVILAYRQNTTTEATLTNIPLQVNMHVETIRYPPKNKFSYFYGLSRSWPELASGCFGGVSLILVNSNFVSSCVI